MSESNNIAYYVERVSRGCAALRIYRLANQQKCSRTRHVEYRLSGRRHIRAPSGDDG